MTDTLPIGPLQEGIWLFWKLNPTSPAYSMPEVFTYEGEFDIAAADYALNEVVRRHEALRTTFHESESGPVQIVERSPSRIPLAVVDLNGLPAAARKERLDAAVHAASNTPFDLSTGPVIRLSVIRESATRTTLVLITHHIVCDGSSMSLIVDELGRLYAAARRGAPPEFSAAGPGYGAFVRSQLIALTDGSLSEEEAYWQARLAHVKGSTLPGIPAKTTGQPVALNSYTLNISLDARLAESVGVHARRVKSTPFAILLCAMQVMITLATGDGDVAIGTAVSSRTSAFARAVGAFANMVVVRSRIDSRHAFGPILNEVALDLMEAIDQRALPFSRMAANLHSSGSERGVGIVRTVFSAAMPGQLSFGEGRVSQIGARTVEGPFDLVVICDLSKTGVNMEWEFALRAYSPDAAGQYCAAYQEILAALLLQPGAAICSLRLPRLPNAESTAPRDATGASAVDVSRPQNGSADGAPTPLEAEVAAIWADVIGCPVVRPYDDFFDLGGHSMLASEAVVLVRNRLTVIASLRLLFDHPQLRDFCSRLKDAGDGEIGSRVTSVPRLPREGAG